VIASPVQGIAGYVPGREVDGSGFVKRRVIKGMGLSVLIIGVP
jgi:hypothetical protein